MIQKTYLTLLLCASLAVIILGTFLIIRGEVPVVEDITSSGYSTAELEFFDLINDYRAANGVGKISLSDTLSLAAERHSEDMAKYNFFSHITEESDYFDIGATPWDRMNESGYTFNTWKGENIAAGQETAIKVFNAWKDSEGHNETMLNENFNAIGISLIVGSNGYIYYWTTDFGGYSDTPITTTTTTSLCPTTTTTASVSTTTTTQIAIVPSGEPVTSLFSDIPLDFYAYDAIVYSYEHGYFKGYDDGTFRPYDNILVGHVNKLFGFSGDPSYWSISDRVYVSDAAKTPLYGRADMTLGLDEPITRAQVAILIQSRDLGLRNPSPENQLVGYVDKSKEEIAYLKEKATEAKLTCTIEELVSYYNKWAPIFGLRADFALSQAIKETGHFRYGGIVQWTDNNFCGLGATGSQAPATFATAELGVIAHLSHLAAYAYPVHLPIKECSTQYDPRHSHYIYSQLHALPGDFTRWIQLNGVWAVPGPTYAQDIARIATLFFK